MVEMDYPYADGTAAGYLLLVGTEGYGSNYGRERKAASYYFDGKEFNSYKEYQKAYNSFNSKVVAFEILPQEHSRYQRPKNTRKTPRNIILRLCPMTACSRRQLYKQKRKARLHSLYS